MPFDFEKEYVKIKCFWEHNGDDTLLYSVDRLGAFTRGNCLDAAKSKMPKEIISFAEWSGEECTTAKFDVEIAEEKASTLNISDADSDAIFVTETVPMSVEEYTRLKNLALKSAADFFALYKSIPRKDTSCLPERKTFYGKVPRTAEEMYEHTKNVNDYYFGEIGVECDNDGDILSCRERGFALLEKRHDFLDNRPVTGSYDEIWSLKKVLRRFIWHDRIHAKAMYKMALKTFGKDCVPDIFRFGDI